MCEKLDSVFSHSLLEIRVPVEADYLGPCYSGFRADYGMETALIAPWDTDGGMQLPDSNQTSQQLSVLLTMYLVDSASRAGICTVLQYFLSYQSGFSL